MGSSFPDQGSNPRSLHWQHRVLATGPPGKSLGFLYKSVSLSKPYSSSGKRKEKKKKKGVNTLMGLQWKPDGEKCQKSRSNEKKAQTTPFLFLISQDFEMYPHRPAALMFLSLDSSCFGAWHALSSPLAGSRSPIPFMKPSYLPSSGRVMTPFFVAQDLAFSALLIFLEFRHF